MCMVWGSTRKLLNVEAEGMRSKYDIMVKWYDKFNYFSLFTKWNLTYTIKQGSWPTDEVHPFTKSSETGLG